MRRLFAALLCLLPFAAPAKNIANTDWGKFEYDFEDEKPWVELQAQLPDYPKDENLLPLYVSATTDNRFFVDGKSISIGGDGVIRYTLVVRSSAGASNVSFEGIRCVTHEHKLYAFGHAGGTWSRARFSKWEPIRYEDRNRQHHVLYDDFFCPNGIAVTGPQAAVDALKRGFRP
jgi:hypothetical protein